jgi:hypothetical protein
MLDAPQFAIIFSAFYNNQTFPSTAKALYVLLYFRSLKQLQISNAMSRWPQLKQTSWELGPSTTGDAIIPGILEIIG